MKPGLFKRIRARGQAMIEYSFVAHAILLGGALAGWPFIAQLMHGLTEYYRSIYYVITSPVP